MPALTRRRDPDIAQETWRIYYGDVHAGTIAQCVGNPGAAPMWQWRCGFYPGSWPGECTNGTAETFDEARADFETAWQKSAEGVLGDVVGKASEALQAERRSQTDRPSRERSLKARTRGEASRT